MDGEFKRIVEINGVKVEVDLRTAKRVDSFKVGDAVKILIKQYSTYESRFGMIIAFDEFKALPTIVVASIKPGSYSSPLEFHYINEKTEGLEICIHDEKDIGYERANILDAFDSQMNKLKNDLKDLEIKKAYFIKMFGRYFEKTDTNTNT